MEKQLRENVAKTVRMIMDESGYKTKVLAEATGLSLPTFYQRREGRNSWRVEELVRLGDFLKVDVLGIVYNNRFSK